MAEQSSLVATLRWAYGLGARALALRIGPYAAGQGSISIDPAELVALLDRLDRQDRQLAQFVERAEAQAERLVRAEETRQQIIANAEETARGYEADLAAAHSQLADADQALQQVILTAGVVADQRDAARAEAAEQRDQLGRIARILDLALPSEQTGPEWNNCVRVPVARLEAIDAILAESVLAEPAS